MKKITIGEREHKFNTSAFFLLKYKQNFNEDALQVVFPLIKALLPLTETMKDMDVSNLSTGEILNLLPILLEHAEGIEILDLYQLLYAMEAAADKEIGDFEEWISNLDDFPLFDVVGEVFPEIIKTFSSTVKSKKNKKNQTKK